MVLPWRRRRPTQRSGAELLVRYIIAIGSVVRDLTKSFSEQVSQPVSQSASDGKPCIYSRIDVIQIKSP